MKRITSLILALAMMLSINITAFAAELNQSEEVERLYRETYEECLQKNVVTISDDYEAYAYLLKILI